jgi:phage tail sheath gpL-like
MTISFNDVPTNLRIPFAAAEFDSSQASQGPAILTYRALLVGQKTAGGTATANTSHRVTSVEDVVELAGRGSMLHRMAIAWFASNTMTEAWVGVLADDGAGASAAGTITVTGPATEDGTIALYVGGTRVAVGVTSGDSANAIATAIEAALDADVDLPITSAVAGAVVTSTFRHKGEVGNGLDIRHSYRDGEGLPAGVGLAIVQPTGGTSNPALGTLIAALGDAWFHVIAHPYVDATSLTALEAELADRFGSLRMIDAVAITSAEGSFGTLTTLGSARNSKHSAIVAQDGPTPITPPYEFAAETAALVARYGAADPARPFQTIEYKHALPPAEADRWSNAERNLLLYEGIATSKVGPGDVVIVDRLITTYQENAAGADDVAYLDLNTPLTLSYLRFSWRTRWLSKYPRHKLADDGARFGAGQAVITPKLAKAEALGWFRDMEELGLVENFDQFKTDLVVERNISDRNRLDFLLPPDLVNQLIVSATKFAFRL